MNIQGLTPNLAAPLQAQSTSSARATTNGSSSSTGSSGLLGGSATSLQSTFLNLLVTELQNQDPTSPVDPTQMVGQMVSLNQLNQLIAINSTLTTMTGGTASAAGSGSTAKAQVATIPGENPASPQAAGAAQYATNSQAQSTFIPVDANAMLNLYGGVAPVALNSNTFPATGGK